MKRMNLRRTMSNALLTCGALAATSASAQSQGGYGMGSGGMMGNYSADWMGGGYGGLLLPVLLIAVVVGVVVWVVTQKRK